jgi:NAD(P)-dependent dehydrogenase (short-subunit alcohol dehydrogenase family)
VDEFFLSGDDVEVCCRGGRRYRARLVEVQQEANMVRKIEFPEDQVLWITGGTRGLGYLCAEHFVKNHGVKRVVLTGREDFPEGMLDPDNERIDANVSPGMRKKMKAIRALRKLGAQVRVLSTSLDDEASVEKDVREVTENFGRIGGVIHCAGIHDESNPAFIRKSTDEIQRVLGPKVSGLNFLVSHMSQEPLRFFLLYSSVSAIVPALAAGQSDYAMANAYMDYVAEARPFDCPVISIQWPSWKETGMGEAVSEAYRQSGLLSITDEEGVGFLDEIVAMGRSGSVVFPCAVDRSRFKSDALLRP